MPPLRSQRTKASGWLWSWALAIPTSSSKADLAWKYISWATGPQYLREAGTKIPGGWAAIPPGTRRSTYEIPEYKAAAAAFARPTLDAIESAPIDNPGTTKRPGLPGVHYVGIPGFPDVANQCTEQFSAVIAGRSSIGSALRNCQNIASRASARLTRPCGPRQIAPVALVLALTVAGFVVARLLAERGARRDSEHRAEVAAAQIHDRVTQGASLTESLRRFMLDASGTGVSRDQFARNALSWLSPEGFQAAAWVERVPDARRAAYERRIGQPIVTPDGRRSVVAAGSRSSYLAATLVSGFDPMAFPGTDLSGEPGMAAVLARATRLDGVGATPVAPPSTGTSGLFLVAPAPNLIDEVIRPGYVVVFLSDEALRAAATDAPTVRIATAGTPTDAREGTKTASRSFTEAGQRFDVVLPREAVAGAAALVPWMILAAGLVLAGLAAALGVSSVRRARAQDELDRIFTLSSDLIAVADFDGRFTRVNPAAERILGYTRGGAPHAAVPRDGPSGRP